MRTLPRPLRCFGRASSGTALVEFAVIFPVLVLIYLGLVGMSEGLSLNRKLSLVARTISDLLGRTTTSMTCTSFGDRLVAATAVLAPYNPSGMTISVASVTTNNLAVATVMWSQARQITAAGTQTVVTVPAGWAEGSTVTPPTGFAIKNATFFLTKIEKQFQPIAGSGIVGPLTLGETLGWPIRNSQPVLWSGTKVCP
jgi:Flp pilus assembly protein TadG